MFESIHDLPLAARAQKYRELAAEALEQARRLPEGDQKQSFIRIAFQWASLAENCEKLAGGKP